MTYRPTDDSTDPAKFRKIKVTMDQPGLKVLTREGYYLQYAPPPVNSKAPSLQLVTDLLAADASTMVYDGVPITAVRSEQDPGMFEIRLAARGLYWTRATKTEARHADFILIASTFDAKGKELSRDAKTYRIAATGEVSPTGPLQRAVEIKYHVDPGPTAVRARFTVRVTATGRIGTVNVGAGPETK